MQRRATDVINAVAAAAMAAAAAAAAEAAAAAMAAATGWFAHRYVIIQRNDIIRVRTIVTIGLSLRPIVALSDDYRSR